MPEPVLTVDLEAGAPAPALPTHTADGRAYTRAAVALRVHGVLVGVTELALAPTATLTERAAEALRPAVAAHLAADAVDDCRAARARLAECAPSASVVVATRDGERTLASCLDSLIALEYGGRVEIVVVDNGSAGAEVREISGGYGERVRYVREDRAGLAVAHNTGLAHATGEVVAFVDDDVVVDRLWLAQLAAAFEAADDVACVTGLILPVELDTPAQLWVDSWGFGKGFARAVFDGRRTREQPLHPYTAGAFGSGANMAFRADVLRGLGGFDPALGTGSPARGGDDLAAFFAVLATGRRLVYEPTAVVRHRHRADYGSLRHQAYGYGVGLSAYLAKAIADDPRRALELARRAPAALAHLLAAGSPKNSRRPADFPHELTRLERRGMLVGPLAYAHGRWRRRALYAGHAR